MSIQCAFESVFRLVEIYIHCPGCFLIDTYGQYKEKLAELKQLQEKMGGSDLGEELDEMEVLRCAQVSEICESLVHSLQILENPQMRYLLATVSPKMTRQGPRGNRPEGDEPVTYIVAPKLRAGMVKTLQGNLFSVIYLELFSNSKLLSLLLLKDTS